MYKKITSEFRFYHMFSNIKSGLGHVRQVLYKISDQAAAFDV